MTSNSDRAFAARRQKYRRAGGSVNSLYLQQSPLVCFKLFGSWNTAFGQDITILRILEIVKFRNIAQSYKETWRSDFSAVWIFNNYVGVGSRAIYG